MPHFDTDAYLCRIGYSGSREPTVSLLHALTLAHTQAIPFENLDVLMERRIDLSPEGLARKMIHEGRGGYCFEQNGLFLLALESLGFDVTPVSARARINRSRDEIPPQTHLFIRVELAGETWLTDVGVGGWSLTSAIRMLPDVEQSTPHEPRRILSEGGRYFHQLRLGDAWHDVCEFRLEPMPLIDREVANWYVSTHPQSHFKNRMLVARALPNGDRMHVLNNEFCVRHRDGSSQMASIGSEAELRALLQSRFQIQITLDHRVSKFLEPATYCCDRLCVLPTPAQLPLRLE